MGKHSKPMATQKKRKPKRYITSWVVVMLITVLIASIYSLGVGCVVVVLYIFAFLLTILDGKNTKTVRR